MASLIQRQLFILILISNLLWTTTSANVIQEEDQDDDDDHPMLGYSDGGRYLDYLGSDLAFMEKRKGCIRRGASCDHRPSGCCSSSVCRCNLWGTHCRCQRMGLFQKWG